MVYIKLGSKDSSILGRCGQIVIIAIPVEPNGKVSGIMLIIHRPVITLCGSTKFKQHFIEVNERLTLKGALVFSVGLFGHADGKFSNGVITPDIKNMLDDIHRFKIYKSDAIVVINQDGYIGESTKSEIEFAESIGKKVFYTCTAQKSSDPTEDPLKEIYDWVSNFITEPSIHILDVGGGYK